MDERENCRFYGECLAHAGIDLGQMAALSCSFNRSVVALWLPGYRRCLASSKSLKGEKS